MRYIPFLIDGVREVAIETARTYVQTRFAQKDEPATEKITVINPNECRYCEIRHHLSSARTFAARASKNTDFKDTYARKTVEELAEAKKLSHTIPFGAVGKESFAHKLNLLVSELHATSPHAYFERAISEIDILLEMVLDLDESNHKGR